MLCGYAKQPAGWKTEDASKWPLTTYSYSQEYVHTIHPGEPSHIFIQELYDQIFSHVFDQNKTSWCGGWGFHWCCAAGEGRLKCSYRTLPPPPSWGQFSLEKQQVCLCKIFYAAFLPDLGLPGGIYKYIETFQQIKTTFKIIK